MGKSQKYSEDQLLDAVVKYSEYCNRKIKATELAKWCRENLVGLEEVRDYHFKRNIKKRDYKTGNNVERKKLCTLKIDEINNSRSLTVVINSNMIFKASNIDVIFDQPISVQRKLIVDARAIFDKLIDKNYRLEKENKYLSSINKKQIQYIENSDSIISDLQKSFNKITKQTNYLLKEVDLEKRKLMLRNMGVKDGEIDLNVYIDSLQQSMHEVLSIKKILLDDSKNSSITEESTKYNSKETENINKKFSDEIIGGIDFD